MKTHFGDAHVLTCKGYEGVEGWGCSKPVGVGVHVFQTNINTSLSSMYTYECVTLCVCEGFGRGEGGGVYRAVTSVSHFRSSCWRLKAN